MLPSQIKPENICLEIPNVCFIPQKMNILESYPAKLCIQECPSLLTTVEDLDNQLDKDAAIFVNPNKSGHQICGKYYQKYHILFSV